MILKKTSTTFLLLTLLIAFVSGLDNKVRPVKLFILGGQSNMDGTGQSEELPKSYIVHPENTVTWDNNMEMWVPLGKDSFAEKRKGKFGPEIAFSHKLAKAFPNYTIAVVKTSAGGTKLWKHWLPDQPMYSRFLKNMKLYKKHRKTLQLNTKMLLLSILINSKP